MKTIEGRFVALPHSVLDDPAFRGMSSAAKVVVLAVAHLFDGKNNGQLGFGERSGEKWGLSQKTTRRALAEGRVAGFLIKTQAASFTSKRLQAEWAIAWQKLPADIKPIPLPEIIARGKNAVQFGQNSRCNQSDGEKTDASSVKTPSVTRKRSAA
jgi:hypothetical protein